MMIQRSALFIVRDGAIIKTPTTPSQGLAFVSGVIRNLYFIRQNLNFDLVMVVKQSAEAQQTMTTEINRSQAMLLEIFKNEDIAFDHICTEFTLQDLCKAYDMANSCFISADLKDIQYSTMLGCKRIIFTTWDQITEALFAGERVATVKRTTKETDIDIRLNMDGSGKYDISTGIGFFNHLLEQLGKHGGLDLYVSVKGDLHVDEHHAIEDTAIALGEAVFQALGNKRGIERYGFCLPMDDCLCSVALDFGGRSFLVWDARFVREMIGDMPTEMIPHFFKSFSDAAKMNLHITASGENEHHKVEGIFKALAKAIKMAVKRDIYKYELPSTKGVL